MINAKGEWVYTNSEIAHELDIAPNTVYAIGKRLFGRTVIPHWTLDQAKTIAEYIRSMDAVEEGQRLAALHTALNGGVNHG